MNWEQYAKKKGFKKAKIKMIRVPVYARTQPGSYKETVQVVYIENPAANRTGVFWKNTMGTMVKNHRGEWSSINTDKAKFEVESVQLLESKMRTFEQYIAEQVSDAQLKQVEKFADRLFSELDIDVAFTKHFKDRVNDARNKPSVTAEELMNFFKKAFAKQGQNIASLPDGRQALLNDIQKELNLPFVYKWDGRNFEFDLVAKTIMRKKDFKTRDKVMRF